VRDIDAPRYTEHHAGDALEYRFEAPNGLPFPAFAAATEEYPELRAEAQWEDDAQGLRGRAVIENGRLVEHENAPLDGALTGAHVEIGLRGELVFALACRRADAGWIGYCVDAARHAYVAEAGPTEGAPAGAGAAAGTLNVALGTEAHWTHRIDAQGAVTVAADRAAIAPAQLAELEELAFAFAGAWLWFDESPAADIALERKRYADHGWTAAGANLRSERLLVVGAGQTWDTLAPEARALRARLRKAWSALAA